jgi:hypothetical protein
MRGRVEIDGVIGMMVFLFFVSWIIVYYLSLSATLSGRGNPLEDVVSDINGKVMDFLQVSVTEVPVVFDSPSSTTDSVLFLDFIWPAGTKNSTKVFSGSSQLPCEIDGDILYWEVDLESGENYFTMRFSTQNVSLNCTASLNKAGANETVPFVGEQQEMVSQAQIDSMLAMPYSEFRDSIGVIRNFYIELNISNNLTTYGSLPAAGDVFVVENPSIIEETDQAVTVRVHVFS